ncbi:MAG: alpha/beta hydrolase [Acidimicrobiia bacterium]
MGRPDVNPDALEGAAEPVVEYVAVEGASLYTEVRGAGEPVLIVGAADEDAEIYRGIAERLAVDSRVVTYDRRGTSRSDKAGWPSDSARHADDAATLIERLNLGGATVLGASAGGVVALRLALRHPEQLKTVLCFEPGAFHAVEDGDAFRLEVLHAVDDHLRKCPEDWVGATDALGRAAVSSITDRTSLFKPPAGREWFFRHAASNAESLIRGDMLLTGETFEPDEVASCPTNLRFSYGTASIPIFRSIAETLAAQRDEQPDVLHGVSHGLFLHPDEATQYVASWT